MQELVQVIEGLDVDMLQQIVGRAVIKHALELVNKVDHGHDQREPMHDIWIKKACYKLVKLWYNNLLRKACLKVLSPSWTILMVTHRLPRFHFMCGGKTSDGFRGRLYTCLY